MRIRAKKITGASLFKVLFIGFSISFFFVTLMFGIANLFGAGTVTLNDLPITGVKGLIAALIMYPIFCLLFTSLMWLGYALSFWVYSHFKKIEIEFVEGEVILPSPSIPPLEIGQE